MMSDDMFLEIAAFFQAMKSLHGPEFVNSTLSRHKALRNVLIEKEKDYIMRIESSLLGDLQND